MQTAVLFDLDGVIVDTESQYTSFWREIGKQYFPENPNFALAVKGMTLVNLYKEYFDDRSEDQKNITAALTDFEQHMQYPEVPGAFRFVRELRSHGILTAVVTSSNNDKMRALYAAVPEITSLFDKIFTAENSKRSKPFPDCFVNGAQSFGLDPSQCYVFEDSVNGLRAAVDSGACVVGLTTSNPPEVVQQFTSHIIPDFTNFTVADLLAMKRTAL